MKKISLLLLLVASIATQAQTPQQVIDKYIDAIGGKDALAKIKDYTIYSTGDVQGNTLEIKELRKDKFMMLRKVEISGMGEVAKTICDGTTVKIESPMMGNQELSGDMLAVTRLQGALFPELEYANGGLTMSVAGVEKVNGVDNNKLELKIGELTWYEFYDATTGLKSKMVMDTPQGSSTILYDEYKLNYGVKFPMKLKTIMPMGELGMEVTDIDINAGLKDADFK